MKDINVARRLLEDVQSEIPLHSTWVHYKTGDAVYLVIGHSIDEATMTPLVTYISLEKLVPWTRTMENFQEMIGTTFRFKRVTPE